MPLETDDLHEAIKFTDFLFDNLSSAIFMVDKNFKVKKVNDSYKALFHKEEVEVLNQLCGNSLGCSFAVEEDKPCGSTTKCRECTIRNCVHKVFGKDELIHSAYVTRKFYIDGSPINKYFRIKSKKVKYNDEEMAVITVDDVTELEEQKIRILEMANKDFLTGLHNRRYLFEYGEKIFQNAKRGNLTLAVVMLDIDFFKKVNDTYGHDAGDFILISLADILKSNFRKADLLTRIGGEEFCLLLNVKKHDDALLVMEKIRKLIQNQKFIYEQTLIPITISCGITNIMEDTLENMIKKADLMLYEAKGSGRNKVLVYNYGAI